MACRPFAFGVRLRDVERARTLNIRKMAEGDDRYLVEDERPGEPARRAEHESLTDAIAAGARIWRHRLN